MAINWYVLHSKPNQEEFLWEQLSNRDVEVYYPYLIVKPVNPRSRTRRALFPGYLFVHFDLHNENLSTLLHLPGAANLVSFGGEPAIVPEGIVQAIKRKVEQGVIESEKKPSFQPGDIITIREGLLEGYEGIVDSRLSGADRVRIFLRLLQSKNLAVELPVTSITSKKNPGRTK